MYPGRLDLLPLGGRVVVRHLIEDGERATDALGQLLARDEDTLTVRTRRGDVVVPRALVVAARPVPPAPPRRSPRTTTPGQSRSAPWQHEGMSPIPGVAVTDLPDDAVLLDVREDDEWAAGHAPGAVHVPLGDVPARLGELPDAEPLAVVCRSGGRSGRAVEWLAQQGYDMVNVEGGMQAWAQAGKAMTATGPGDPEVI